MSLATEIDSTYISSNNAKQHLSFKQQTKKQTSKKFETDSSLVDTTLTGVKQQSVAPDSGLSSAKTENLKQSSSNLTSKSKKLPLKITQDDNRLTINLESSGQGTKYEPNTNSKKKQNDQPVIITQQAPKAKTHSSSLARHIRSPHFKSYRSKSDQTKTNKRDTSQTNNENLIRIIKENIEPLNQLQPCDLFLLPLLQLSDYGTDYMKLKTANANNDLLLANLVKSTTASVAKNRTSTLITTTTTTTKQTTTTTEEQEELSIHHHQSNLQHSTSFLTEFANMFQQTKNKMVNSTKKENKKTGNTNTTTTNTNRNLKELIGEAGDLTPLFMPIVQLAEIDLERKKTNRLMNTFKQVTESYRRNRKLSKEPLPVPKPPDLIIDKSKSLINLNQVLNQSITHNSKTGGVPTAPVTAPIKKKFNNFNFLKTNTNINSGPNAPDPPPRTHSIPGYSSTRLTSDDSNKKENYTKDLDLINKHQQQQHALLATRLTFSTTNTSMDLNNSDVYVNKYSNQSWALNANENNKSQQQQEQTLNQNHQLVLHQDQIANTTLNTTTAFKALNNLNDINTSIGDIIRLLKSSSSSGSGSTHSNKLDALKHEIDKTMNEISTFKNEVSTRMKNNNTAVVNNTTNLYNLDSASLGQDTFSNNLNNTSHYNQLSKYEKDILSILSRQQLKFQPNEESRLVTMDTAVNTDISMSNAVFTIRYDDDEEEQEIEEEDEDDDDTTHNNPILNSKQISVSSQTPRSSPIIVEHDDDDHYINSFINMDLMTQLRQQNSNNNSSSLFRQIKIEEHQDDDPKTDDSILEQARKVKKKNRNKISILDDDDDEDILLDDDKLLNKLNKKDKKSGRRALTPLPIVESPTETYTTSNKSTYYYGNDVKPSKFNFKVNSHTLISNSNKSETSNVPALSLLHRDTAATLMTQSSPATYESNQSIGNIDSSTSTTTPNNSTSSNTQQQHEENLKRLKIRIKNRQQNSKVPSNTSQKNQFRRNKSSNSAHNSNDNDDDLYEEYNNRVNRNHDDDILIDDEDLDDDDDDEDDTQNLMNINDTTVNTTTTTNTSNSSNKKNANNNVFKKIFTRTHYTQFGNDYNDESEYYGQHNNIRIEPISLVNIKATNSSNAPNSKRSNFVNIERISSTSSSTTGSNASDININKNSKQQIKIPIKIINNSSSTTAANNNNAKQQPLIKSPIINFANQKPQMQQQQQHQKKETKKQHHHQTPQQVDYTTFDSLADTTANISSSRSRCTVINSGKPNKPLNRSPEEPQVKLKIIPLKRSNTLDQLSNNNSTCNSNKKSNQYYAQCCNQYHHHHHHCNTCACCQCPRKQCFNQQQQQQQAPLVMNIRDARFSSANKSSKFKFQQDDEIHLANLTKSSTTNQLPVNKYNHTTYHYKTNYSSSTTPSNNSSTNNNIAAAPSTTTTTKRETKKTTETIAPNSSKSKQSHQQQNQQQQRQYLDEKGRYFNKNFLFNAGSNATSNKQNQHMDELSLLENLDEELDREIAKTIKSKSINKSNSKSRLDCSDYSKMNVSEEDLLSKEIGFTLNSLRRPHSAFQIDSYPALNDDLFDMDNDDEDEDDDESGNIIAVAEEEDDSSSDSNMSHYKVNLSNYMPHYDLPKSKINKQQTNHNNHHYQQQQTQQYQYQQKRKDSIENYFEVHNYQTTKASSNPSSSYTKSQQQFINKFPIHINNHNKKQNNFDASMPSYEYEDNRRNYYKSNNTVASSKNSTQSVQMSKMNPKTSGNQKNQPQNQQQQQQQPNSSKSSSKKETQKYFIHYPIGSSSNLTNTNTSSTNNETMSYFDFSVRDLAKSPFQLQHEYNDSHHQQQSHHHQNINHLNLSNDIMSGGNDNAELNNFESTVMLNAYKLPKKKMNNQI